MPKNFIESVQMYVKSLSVCKWVSLTAEELHKSFGFTFIFHRFCVLYMCVFFENMAIIITSNMGTSKKGIEDDCTISVLDRSENSEDML